MKNRLLFTTAGAVITLPLALYLSARIGSSVENQPTLFAITYRTVASLMITAPSVAACVIIWHSNRGVVRSALLGSLISWQLFGLMVSFIAGI